ncbi:MAG TPA: DNA mismatch repair endonuclease MutL [Acholeplasmataceae bacterium]|nr:DNA mismatch repair endonuclease MutL [Acholeplasmataceae bacterium]
MGIIKPLDEKIANMIAAGEVVERPASIVKELIENSIDAKATTITVEILEFGMKLIKVTDDGVGMDKSDLKMAFYRHATSKIYSENDLLSIKSLGFRGEAIPAIASVSKTTIASRQAGKTGHEVIFEAGHFSHEGAASMNQGTVVTVENLFYNTPARFKYMKSERAEVLAITETFERLAITNPQIRMELIIDNKSIRKTFGQDDPYSIISSIYGAGLANNLTSFTVEQQKIKIEFILLSHQYTRTNKRDINIFINNRYIQNYLLKEAVIKGFSSKIMTGRYPIAIVKVFMDESLVDVNVHPQKLEVKMVNEYFLSDLIERSIKDKLTSKTHVIPTQSEVTFPKRKEVKESYLQESFDLTFMEEELERIEERKVKLPSFDYIGTLAGTYLLFQNEDGLYLLDQHAAEERVRYEYYHRKLGEIKLAVTDLLIPYELELSTRELEQVHSLKDKLLEFGFKFDTNNHLIQAPTWIRSDEYNEAIIYLIEQLSLNKKISLSDYRDNMAKSMSCKASVKANHQLSHKEVLKLVEDLSNAEFPYTCPHGRPTLILLSHYDIEKLFKRVV